jgi:hypothetical protein
MAGINVGPGFMGRLGGQMPGALNALGQKYGGSMSGPAKASASLLGKQRTPSRPKVTSGMGKQQLPGQQIPIQAPGLQAAPQEIQAQMPAAVNTAPSPQLFQNPYANIFGGSSGYGSSGNTGIAGGLFNRPPGYERPNMGAAGTDIGGMFGAYNRFSRPQSY